MLEDWDNRPLAVDVDEWAEPEIGRFVWLLEASRERLKERLVGLDVAMLDFELPNENSIGTLLYHLADIEMSWLFEEVLETDTLPDEVAAMLCFPTRDEAGRLTRVNGRSLTQHLDILERTRRYLLDTFQQMTLADFRRVRQMENYSCTPEWVLHHLIQHETEHRGQIMAIRTQAEARNGV